MDENFDISSAVFPHDLNLMVKSVYSQMYEAAFMCIPGGASSHSGYISPILVTPDGSLVSVKHKHNARAAIGLTVDVFVTLEQSDEESINGMCSVSVWKVDRKRNSTKRVACKSITYPGHFIFMAALGDIKFSYQNCDGQTISVVSVDKDSYSLQERVLSARLPCAKEFRCAVSLSPESFMLIGGYSCGTAVSECYVVETEKDKIVRLPDYPIACYHVSASMLQNGMIFAAGGAGRYSTDNNCSYFVNSCFLYDPKKMTWKKLPSMIQARAAPIIMSRVSNNNIIYVRVFGGFNHAFQSVEDEIIAISWNGDDFCEFFVTSTKIIDKRGTGIGMILK